MFCPGPLCGGTDHPEEISQPNPGHNRCEKIERLVGHMQKADKLCYDMNLGIFVETYFCILPGFVDVSVAPLQYRKLPVKKEQSNKVYIEKKLD